LITDEDKECVRQATDFLSLVSETVVLKQRGQDFWGCCPFHHEKTPSFKINPTTGLWHCFGCGAGGDMFTYVMKRENLSFPDAIRYLADRAGIELKEEQNVHHGPKRSRLLECLAETERFYEMMLFRGKGEGPAAARKYFASRGFNSPVCKRWNLGYAPGHSALVRDLKAKGFTTPEMVKADVARERNGHVYDRFFDRVMFPIHDEQGRTIAFGGRILQAAKHDGIAKYINTGDTPVFNKRKHLFAIDKARDTIVKTSTAIVCEGYTDVIAMHEAGFTDVVAALGTAFSLDHIKALERLRVQKIICMFDGDAAGQRAAERAIQYIDKTTADLVCVVLPNGQDPKEFLSSHTAEEMQRELDGAQPLMSFVFQKRLQGYNLSIPGQRVKALDDMATLLSPLKNSPLLDGYANDLADALGMDTKETKRHIQMKPAPKQNNYQQWQQRPKHPPLPANGPLYEDADYYQEDEYEEPAIEVTQTVEQNTMRALSADDRQQIAAERELLAMIAQRPDLARAYADTIGDFSWADERNQKLAWAMLATPEGSTPQQVVDAAEAVDPQAPKILSGGSIAAQEDWDGETKMGFLVNSCDLYSVKRQLRQIRSQLRQTQDNLTDATRNLMNRAQQLSQRESEISQQLLKTQQSQ
jgi:DNA primase